MALATFAGGCFWGIEALFQQAKGVNKTRVGYIGGHTPNPSYQDVCSDQTGHAEAVEIEFNPTEITYEKLLEIFFNHHNPTLLNRQGPDLGSQYRSAIFFHSKEQEAKAHAMIQKLTQLKMFDKPIVTEVVAASVFYPAEEYHQQYLLKQGKSHC